MYNRYFKLSESPFTIAPDPRYLYMSVHHQEAFEHLNYGVNENGGFVLLTGEAGTGKTTLCRRLLTQLPDDVDIALILNPRLNAVELLASICDELRIDYPANTNGIKDLIQAINEYLLSAHMKGRRTVLIIDEAQNLSFDVLEQIRLLTNLETARVKLLQIILVGQQELYHILKRRNLRQLMQRITCHYELKSLTRQGSNDYINHRISVAGGNASALFTKGAINKIHRLSGGIPRLINLLCDRSLHIAYINDQEKVDTVIVRKAAREAPVTYSRWRVFADSYWLPALATIVIIGIIGFYIYPQSNSSYPILADKPPRLPATEKAVEIAVNENPVLIENSVVTETPINDVQDDNDETDGTDAETIPKLDILAGKVKSQPGPPFRDLLTQPGLTMESAFEQLLAQWGVNDVAGNAEYSCGQVLDHGLRCLYQTSSWHFMRRLNRPAILEFQADNGRKQYATVVAMDDYNVTLNIDKQLLVFPLQELLGYWHGHYILLWKPLSPGRVILRLGDTDESVLRLRKQLMPHDEQVISSDKTTYFDKALKQRLIAFQISRGLEADGVAGPRTVIHLNNVN